MNHFNIFLAKYGLPAQFIKYAIIGILTNLIGYLGYLLFTDLGADPKVVVSIMYPIGVLGGYFGNSNITFPEAKSNLAVSIKYFFIHFLGYGLNLSLLYLFVDNLGYSHRIVQAIAIIMVAIFLYASFKYFVFNKLKD